MKTPLKFYRIRSRYNRDHFYPVQHRYQAHLGTDYAAPEGTPIRSVGDGIIEEAFYSQFNGKYVKFRHNSIYTTQYLHISRIADGIKNRVKVKQVDAQKVKLPPSTPIPTYLLVDFESITDSLKMKLDSLVILMPN